MIRFVLSVIMPCLFAGVVCADESDGQHLVLKLSIKSELPYDNVPIEAQVDAGAFIRQSGTAGVLNPNSFEVVDAADGKRVPFTLSEAFAHGDAGRVSFVIHDPKHREYRIQFHTTAKRPQLKPLGNTPLIGTGSLLCYNAGEPRPLVLAYAMALHDLNGDGVRDLLGTWNYFRRPGEPGDSIICHPGIAAHGGMGFGDLVHLRYADPARGGGLSIFNHCYASADFADLNRDGKIDLLYTRLGTGKAGFFLNSGRRDAGGYPGFEPAGSVEIPGWEACRLVDLNGDGALDVVVDGTFVRNTNHDGWPFRPARQIKLDAGRRPCFVDLNRDGRLDAVCLQGADTVQPAFYRLAWRPNLGTDSPTFGPEKLLDGIDASLISAVSAYSDESETGLIVQHDAFQSISFYQLVSTAGEPQFEKRGRAGSVSAPLSLSDQATPCLCDWDSDGDLDLLVGGGYGWPRIVLNTGSATEPVFAEPELILANGKPIRVLRNDILGEPRNWHDMGYTFPSFVDWDGDGLSDLMLPNETNRIFWYRNIGTAKEPRFGERLQILCERFPDSPELRTLSAKRANDPKSAEGVYPREAEQPFFWRTGVAFADFNGDSQMDLATLDGHTRVLTLLTRFRDASGELKLKKGDVLKLTDGRPIDDRIVERKAHWTESFRAFDWDRDGLQDILYSVGGSHKGTKDGGSIYFLKNVGSKQAPVFAPPVTMRCYGQPLRFTNHGPHACPGDLDGDGEPDLLGYVEWSVYPFFSHASLMMSKPPEYELTLAH